MVEELKYRLGGVICNTHLVGFETLTKLIKFQNIHDPWRKVNPEKIEFTCHKTNLIFTVDWTEFMQPNTSQL